MTFSARRLQGPSEEPLALHDRAMDNLRYIRETMERSASFTHVSGLGGVLMGVVALGASGLARSASTVAEWLTIWLVSAGLCLSIAVLSMARKSHAEGVALITGPGRKFAWSVISPLAAGGALTVGLVRAGAVHLLPGMWLLLYGTAVVSGGSHSVRPVPAMGAAFMAAGVAALLLPASWGAAAMALGFGGLHILFGVVIWRKHGG